MVKAGKGSKPTAKKGNEGQRSHALQKKMTKAKENPFDKFSNAKKKHDVINRKVKGEDRNIGRAREKAIEERRKRLLGDYQSSKKSNTFDDKRFGESDASLSLEDKMFLRFQKEKVKKARNMSQFNLDADDTEILTHRGQALGATNANEDEEGFSDDEDGHGGLDKDVVNQLHFGGGLVERTGEDGHGTSHNHTNRLDALQEIVMKSKIAKLQRKEAKEEQETGREELDSAWNEIISAGMLDFKPTGRDKSEIKKEEEALGGTSDFLGYDTAFRGMAYEARAAASDRTKTPEEIATSARTKLEELEAERLRRMRGEPAVAPDGTTADTKASKGGNKEKKKEVKPKMVKKDSMGNDLIDQEDSDSDIESESEDEEEEEDDDDDDEDDDDDDDEEEEDEDEDEDEEEEEEKEEDGAPKKFRKPTYGISLPKRDIAAADKSNSKSSLKSNKSVTATVKEIQPTINEEMPHVIPCPQDYDEFQEQVTQWVQQPADLHALITRIVSYYSVHLPGQLGVDHKSLMHNFLDILLRTFIDIADSMSELSCSFDNAEQYTEDIHGVEMQLDSLTAVIFQLCMDLGESTAAALWGRTLRTFHKQLQKRLRDYAQGVKGTTCFPSLGRLLLLRVLAHVFPVTDFRHPIITPTVLFLCQCLGQCPVSSTVDLASGLYISTLLSTVYCIGTEPVRFVPEVSHFLGGVLRTMAGEGQEQEQTWERLQILGGGMGTMDSKRLKWLPKILSSIEEDEEEEQSTTGALPWSYFSANSTRPHNQLQSSQSRSAAQSMLSLTVLLCRNLFTQQLISSSLPETLTPLLQALKKVPGAAASDLYHDMKEGINRILHTRRALMWRAGQKITIEQKNPKFDLNYSFRKDRDEDQERNKVKQLDRQLKRESKAAMRELRRDSEFLDTIAYNERKEAHSARKDERARNFNFMEEQQATINLQVKKGTNLLKGAGSAGGKRARVKGL